MYMLPNDAWYEPETCLLCPGACRCGEYENKEEEEEMETESITSNVLAKADTTLAELKSIREIYSELLKYPHYKKMGDIGVFAIVHKARSIGLPVLEALNGGMYFVNGKVELASGAMNQLIRKNGHSITKDKRSDDTICILHGRRSDNGDTWTESFSIEEAKRAGIFKERGPWSQYPRDMLFARALSRLARQLFPDVIQGCYVAGEIANGVTEVASDPEEVAVVHPVVQSGPATIDKEEAEELLAVWSKCDPDYVERARSFLAKEGHENLVGMPTVLYYKLLDKSKEAMHKYQNLNTVPIKNDDEVEDVYGDYEDLDDPEEVQA